MTGTGLMWGRCRENGVWLATRPRWRLMHPWNPGGHDSLFIAARRLRIRIMISPAAVRALEVLAAIGVLAAVIAFAVTAALLIPFPS